jgi:endoglycosylceramidase
VISRVLLVALVLAIAACTYPGVLIESAAVRLSSSRAATSQAAPGAMPWLHVEHPAQGAPYIADELGRMVLLHGAIPASLLEFGASATASPGPPTYPIGPAAYEGRCPDTLAGGLYPPLCQADLVQMASFGFNSLRLPLVWSLLEPERGHFNELYVERIAQIVDWARALGMYVIIDMHQNAYSAYVGAGPGVDLTTNSGAPAWATITDGMPSRELAKGKRETNPAAVEAFSNFWYNRDGIQAEYIDAIAHLAERFKNDSTVAGFSVFNEPQPGWNLPPGFEDLLLFPFYRRVIDAITGVGDGIPCWTGFFMPAPCGYPDPGIHDLHHLVFLDTGLAREITDFPTHLGMPLSSYANVVLSMHAYTHIYTFDALAGQTLEHATYPWGGYDQSYFFADREAKAMNAALFVAEFGDSPSQDPLILANQVLEEERHRVGFAFWVWKESGSGGWGMFDPPPAGASNAPSSGCLRADRERLLARIYPRAAGDPNLTYHYDSDTGAFTLSARGSAAGPATVVYIPPEARGAVAVAGAEQVTDVRPDGSRLVTATPSGGDFSITVAPAALVLSGCG